MKAKIVVADDEPRVRGVIALLLKEEGYEVRTASNGQEAVETALAFRPDVILLDQQMPLLTGVQALEKIKAARPDPVVILVTAFGSVSLAVEAVKKGAYDFIEKPFDNDKLLLTVRRAVEHRRMRGEIDTLKSRLGDNRPDIIGERSGLRQVMLQVARVAETDATVLVHGESGTGKELIARAVHDRGKRAGQAFVAVNCGAIPLTLMESELFGHEKGAFTDARDTQAGTFERANGGTLFLDEIGELPLDAQVKLLRVLEDRTITRVGGKKTIPVNVRIVAATNRDLEEEVRLGRFRLDLFYRINIFTLRLPPLRERKEDIPLLAGFFLRKHNASLNLSIERITPEAMDRLCAYDWPGNVRDLENAIQSAMILCPEGQIQPEHLPSRIKTTLIDPLSTSHLEAEDTSLRDTSSQAEKARILAALQKQGYNRTLTAEALNISRKTLFNKMKRYNLGNE